MQCLTSCASSQHKIKRSFRDCFSVELSFNKDTAMRGDTVIAKIVLRNRVTEALTVYPNLSCNLSHSPDSLRYVTRNTEFYFVNGYGINSNPTFNRTKEIQPKQDCLFEVPIVVSDFFNDKDNYIDVVCVYEKSKEYIGVVRNDKPIFMYVK